MYNLVCLVMVQSQHDVNDVNPYVNYNEVLNLRWKDFRIDETPYNQASIILVAIRTNLS